MDYTSTEKLLFLTAISTGEHFTVLHEPNTHYLYGTPRISVYLFPQTVSIA